MTLGDQLGTAISGTLANALLTCWSDDATSTLTPINASDVHVMVETLNGVRQPWLTWPMSKALRRRINELRRRALLPRARRRAVLRSVRHHSKHSAGA